MATAIIKEHGRARNGACEACLRYEPLIHGRDFSIGQDRLRRKVFSRGVVRVVGRSLHIQCYRYLVYVFFMHTYLSVGLELKGGKHRLLPRGKLKVFDIIRKLVLVLDITRNNKQSI